MLVKINMEDEELIKKQERMQSKLKSLEDLLNMQKLNCIVVNRGEIYALLRKISVIQQQITAVGLDYSRLRERREALAIERKSQREKMKTWQLKEKKYECLKSKLSHDKKIIEYFLEETEQEEVYNAKNFKHYFRTR